MGSQKTFYTYTKNKPFKSAYPNAQIQKSNAFKIFIANSYNELFHSRAIFDFHLEKDF